ncbi:MAG: hypothetical protein AABX01_03315 [Candidatus Micrarchaeota archaeon]
MLLALIALASSFLFGYEIAKKLFDVELFAPSLLIGTLAFSWLVFIASLVLGFNSNLVLAASILLVVLVYAISRKAKGFAFSHLKIFSRDSFAVFLVSFLLIGYSSMLAIDQSDGLASASWDTAFHLGIISSISQGNFPPAYPNLSSELLSYYYFLHLFASSLVTGGLSTIFAYQLVQTLLIVSFLAGFYVLAREILGSRLFAFISVALLFFASPCTGCQMGGSAFLSVFSPQIGSAALGMASKGFPFGPTPITLAFIQFTTAFALLFLVVFIRLLSSSRKNRLYEAAVLLGILPMFNAFFFAAFFVMFGFLTIARKYDPRPLVLAAIISIPQFLIMLSQKTAGIMQYFRFELYGGNAPNDLLLFWLQNAGVHIALAAIGVIILRKISRDFAILSLGALALFIFGNFFRIAPYELEASKLFLPFLAIACIYAAGALASFVQKGAALRLLAIAIIAIGLISSYNQFFIYLSPGSVHAPVSLGGKSVVSACEWASQNTPKNSTFIADPAAENSACIYAIAGRRAFLSIPYFVATHGFDEAKYAQIQSSILGGDLDLAKTNGITHIFSAGGLEGKISDNLRRNLEKIYSSGGTSIYLIRPA